MLARYLDVPPEHAVKMYAILDPEDRETTLRQTSNGCVFRGIRKLRKIRPLDLQDVGVGSQLPNIL
jgi:hypothetical protein